MFPLIQKSKGAWALGGAAFVLLWALLNERPFAARNEASATTEPIPFREPALGVNPPPNDEVQAMVLAAKSALAKNNLPLARREFERVLEKSPQDLSALVSLGWIDQKENRWDSSEKHLRKALRASMEDAAIWLALGVATLEQEKSEAALAAFAQAVALEPKNARAHRFLAIALGRRGWLDGAENEMRTALDLEPGDAGAHFNLAVFYLQRRPAAVELARRHYYRARDLGAAPDSEVEAQLARTERTDSTNP
ncbi:MAG: repeat containing protein [Verrucomicrobiota bacterium]|jgi:Flp pilus assembly protein TadD